jgi:hypothetical protein
MRDVRVVQHDGGYGFARGSDGLTSFLPGSQGLALTSVPEAKASVRLSLNQSRESELGRLTFDGSSRFSTGRHSAGGGRSKGPYAVGMSRAILDPENALANASLAHDPALQARVMVKPVASSQYPVASRDAHPPLAAGYWRPATEAKRLTSADVLEALHAATGMPIVADFYTRLYEPGAVSVRNEPLFAALNHLADAMRLRWRKDASAAGEPPAAAGRGCSSAASASMTTASRRSPTAS